MLPKQHSADSVAVITRRCQRLNSGSNPDRRMKLFYSEKILSREFYNGIRFFNAVYYPGQIVSYLKSEHDELLGL